MGERSQESQGPDDPDARVSGSWEAGEDMNRLGEKRRAAPALGATATNGHIKGSGESSDSTLPDWLAKRGVSSREFSEWRDVANKTWASPEAQAWLADVKRMHAAGVLPPTDMVKARKRLFGDDVSSAE